MSMLTFVVDCCIYVWRNAHGLFVNIHVLVIAAVQRDMKMPSPRAKGLVVNIRHHHCQSGCRRCCDAI